MVTCSKHIHKALDLARELIILADEGEAEAQDDGCILFFGVLRDCAYRIRQQADHADPESVKQASGKTTPNNGQSSGT